MGGDFSRLRFQPDRHFAAVLLQQGRVLLDSDWNEAESIREHRQRMLIRDLLGTAAFVGDGFALSARGEKVTIGAGHAWIDGLLCELATDTDSVAQPGLPSARLPTEPGTYVAYLEVWQREVTATEDETLREPALGGPDTTVRLATVAQVRYHRVPGHARRSRADWSVPTEATDATLAVHGRYEGVENRLYRVEIHEGGAQPTFKWSRDNGSTVAALRSWTATELRLRSAQPLFAPGDRLEVIDRASLLDRRPGPFIGVDQVDGDRVVVSSDDEPIPERLVDPVVRRWDARPAPLREGRANERSELGDGLEISVEGSRFRSGDYWLIAARTADRSVTWPDATEADDPRPPHGIEVQRSGLAALRRDRVGWTVLRDLRRLLRG